MKKIRTIAAFALAAMITLASCSKNENTGQNEDGTVSVKISFNYPDETPDTRVEGAAATAGTASFKPGHILFVTGSGLIDKHVGVYATTGTAGSEQVTIADLTNAAGSEVVISGISSSASTCYILSNDAPVFSGANAITGNLEGQNISQLFSKQISVNAINNASGTLDSVPMYGTGTVSPGTGSTATDETPYTATVSVNINSLASRIQIGKFTAQDFTPNSSVPADVVKIKSFTVDGIYINDTYSEMNVASAVIATGPQVDNGSTIANYSKTVGTTDYTTTSGIAHMLADEPFKVAAGTPLAATPTLAYWTYNVFPKGTPDIVVKLSNITYTITTGGVEGSLQYLQSNSGIQWLTIDSYKKADNTALGDFEANNIYTLANIPFDFSDLTDVPYTTTLDVLVSVTMFDWVDVPISWNN